MISSSDSFTNSLFTLFAIFKNVNNMLSLELYQTFSTFVLWVPKTFSNSHRLVLKKCQRCLLQNCFVTFGDKCIRPPPPLDWQIRKRRHTACLLATPDFKTFRHPWCSWPCNQNLDTWNHFLPFMSTKLR